MSPAKRLRSAGAVLGISVLIGVGLVPTVPSTEAAWLDAERATATGTSINVPEPIATGSPGCVASSGLLGANPKVTISWRAPAAATGYDMTKAEFGQIVNQGLLEPILSDLLGNVKTTGSAAAYVTVIDGGLLTGLLGATKTFGIRFTGPGGWKSDWLVANATMGLLGANPQCTMGTTASY